MKPSSNPEVSPSQAASLLDAEDVVLLDVREPEEWAQGHAPVAVHVPLGELDAARFAGATVLAVCRSGRRSAAAVESLAAAGVRARNVTGGMQAWEEASLPVVTDGGQPGSIR